VPFEVRVAPTAARQLAERLPESTALACVEFIFGPLADQPHRVGAPLRPPFDDQWRARRGEYRVRHVIDDVQGVVTVLDVDHVRGIYRSP
jgi:mRNA interferase RelE/StbE